jgi:molybdopterin converting factor subunit 1
MKVAVKLFAAARDLAQQPEVVLDVAPGADVSELRMAMASAWPQLAPLASRSVIAVNSEYASDATLISEGDELALIPPVSGG